MKRFFKLFTLFSLVFLLSSIFVGPTSADVIRGKGWLHAEGAGTATLRMTGTVEIRGHSVGIVYISGAERIVAEGNGKRTDLPENRVVFRGYEGTIKVVGHKMTVRMVGEKIDFTARGKGAAVLRGRGRYETANYSGDWTPDGVTIEVEEE